MKTRHPLHPPLVHFPVACWSLAVAADVAGLRYGAPMWSAAAGLLAVGCAMAVPAMLTGFLELLRVPEGAATRDAYAHMALMLAAFLLFCARLLLGLDGLQPVAPGAALLALDGAGFVCLALGGLLGGRLVYGHGVGQA